MNIFDYAEKELSQDGFLCWLLESFEDPVIGEAARNLIFEFAKLAGFQIDKEKIKDVKTGRQYKHMDVTVDFTIDGKPYLIVIEDKTNSQEHNQLQGYADEEFQTAPLCSVHRIDQTKNCQNNHI